MDHGNSDAGLDRFRRFDQQPFRAPISTGGDRMVAKVIRIDAELYRKSLDTAQPSEQFDAKPALPVTGGVSQLGAPVESQAIQ